MEAWGREAQRCAGAGAGWLALSGPNRGSDSSAWAALIFVAFPVFELIFTNLEPAAEGTFSTFLTCTEKIQFSTVIRPFQPVAAFIHPHLPAPLEYTPQRRSSTPFCRIACPLFWCCDDGYFCAPALRVIYIIFRASLAIQIKRRGGGTQMGFGSAASLQSKMVIRTPYVHSLDISHRAENSPALWAPVHVDGLAAHRARKASLLSNAHCSSRSSIWVDLFLLIRSQSRAMFVVQYSGRCTHAHSCWTEYSTRSAIANLCRRIVCNWRDLITAVYPVGLAAAHLSSESAWQFPPASLVGTLK